MNRDNIFEQLKVDEGVVYAVYKDHLGYPTFGVGHLILDEDEEDGKKSVRQYQKSELKLALSQT